LDLDFFIKDEDDIFMIYFSLHREFFLYFFLLLRRIVIYLLLI